MPLPTVNEAFYHSTRRDVDEPPPRESIGSDLSGDSERWKNWIVKLEFDDNGATKSGTGFFVNIPHDKYDIILTAGHNLVKTPKKLRDNIKIVNFGIQVTEADAYVCSEYWEEPGEDSQIFDWGVIRLEKDPQNRPNPLGFGFNLRLGFSPKPADFEHEEQPDVLQDAYLIVTGHRPQDDKPRRADGMCLSTSKYQITYSTNTETGISGSPVWLGYRGTETVVAIHNYGISKEDKGKPNAGNKGSRLTLAVWQEIFKFLGVGDYAKSLYYSGSKVYTMHLAFEKPEKEARVRVGKPGPKSNITFDVFPVAADAATKGAYYGFLLQDRPAEWNNSGRLWLRWSVREGKVLLTDWFERDCEAYFTEKKTGLMLNVRAQEPGKWTQVLMSIDQLQEFDLENLDDDPEAFEDTSEIVFKKSIKGLFYYK